MGFGLHARKTTLGTGLVLFLLVAALYGVSIFVSSFDPSDYQMLIVQIGLVGIAFLEFTFRRIFSLKFNALEGVTLGFGLLIITSAILRYFRVTNETLDIITAVVIGVYVILDIFLIFTSQGNE